MRSLAKWVPVVLPQRLALEEAARGDVRRKQTTTVHPSAPACVRSRQSPTAATPRRALSPSN